MQVPSREYYEFSINGLISMMPLKQWKKNQDTQL